MSISSMTNAAIARRPDFEPRDSVPKSLAGIAQAIGPPLTGAAAPQSPVAGTEGTQSSASTNMTDALQVIVTYIPTEVLTLYVAVLTALQSSTTKVLWVAQLGFILGTPVVVWILYATKLKAAGRVLPWSPQRWPIWEMAAATTSFFVWAFAMPGTPWAKSFDWYTPGLAGVLVLVISVLLGLIAPLCQQPLKA